MYKSSVNQKKQAGSELFLMPRGTVPVNNTWLKKKYLSIIFLFINKQTANLL